LRRPVAARLFRGKNEGQARATIAAALFARALAL